MPSSGYFRSDGPQCENQRVGKNKYLHLAKELKKKKKKKETVDHQGDGGANCNLYTWNGS